MGGKQVELTETEMLNDQYGFIQNPLKEETDGNAHQ